jgi:tRNA threonylcarbamoyladenosine biosynthesis protein TsaE
VPAADFLSHSPEATIAWGREFASRLAPPLILLLSGELGSGKTTLTKGLISGLGAAAEEEVTSPTFTLVHVFHNHCRVFHVDLYRVDGFHDLETLGLEDALAEPAIVIVEWPEKFSLRTDWPVVRVTLEHSGGDARRIRVSAPGALLQDPSGGPHPAINR